MLRGPHVERYTWFGYEGGLDWRRDRTAPGQVQDAERASRLEKEKDTFDARIEERTGAPNGVRDESEDDSDKGPLPESQTRVPSPSKELEEGKKGRPSREGLSSD